VASGFFDNWTVQVRKGVLELCILKALAGGERYGYELVKALVAVPGLEVAEGTIYPLLSRLKVQGLLTTRLEESPEGPARKYYTLTPAGLEMAEMMDGYFDGIAGALEALRRGGRAQPGGRQPSLAARAVTAGTAGSVKEANR
jgi:PadR family transcriptional regulator PadR